MHAVSHAFHEKLMSDKEKKISIDALLSTRTSEFSPNTMHFHAIPRNTTPRHATPHHVLPRQTKTSARQTLGAGFSTLVVLYSTGSTFFASCWHDALLSSRWCVNRTKFLSMLKQQPTKYAGQNGSEDAIPS
jgi:hypothetical protein